MANEYPSGLCQCGCGLPTAIVKKSSKKRGLVAGSHYRYRHGHGQCVPIETRLWEKVQKEPNGGCWLWTGGTTNGGYGVIGVGRGRLHRAHRISWEIANGPIPDGLKVLHRCDNPPCVNPAHLFLGTQVDNMRDCAAKGRHKLKAQTHCKRGHEFTAENTYAVGDRWRGCLTCRKAYDRKRWQDTLAARL
jgi:hypothetical protein